MTSSVLVTGATGSVGPRVVQVLQDAGYHVRTLSSRAPQVGLLPQPVEVCVGDIANSSLVQSAMEGTAAVIHMAALLHVVNPSPDMLANYEQVNVAGTRAVVDAAIRSGVRRMVFFSTIAVYGYARRNPLTEESPTAPETMYAKTKLAAERIVLDAKRADGQSLGTVLRLGAVYGARVKGNYKRLLQALARGRFVPIGDGSNRRSLIYDQDVARAAVLAAEKPEAAGRIYNLSDGECHTLREIINAMSRALGRTPPRLHLPGAPVRLAAAMLDYFVRFSGRQSSSVRARLDKYLEDVVVVSKRIQNELGFRPQFDLVAGWRETVVGMRRMGELQ